MDTEAPGTICFTLDGRAVEVPDDGGTLLETLRHHLGVRSAKDGCAPQGQCGCCTVMVDDGARVACVTPTRRVAGRSVTTLEGLDPAERDRWTAAFTDCGASQCGFCTPGILVRLAALAARRPDAGRTEVDRALAAHLCRCTGWQTVHEAWSAATAVPLPSGRPATGRDLAAAARRAEVEGGTAQSVGPEVANGAAGFAADTAPAGSLVAVPDGEGGWSVADSVRAARAAVGKVQGRRTTEAGRPPLELPPGDWAAELCTTWVEPAYVETDAAWCAPGGEASSPLANGGAFGAKRSSPLPEVARRLADEHGRPVLALWSREDVTRLGPKRPPVAGGARADGTGVLRVVAGADHDALVAAVARAAPGLEVEAVSVPGPPVTAAVRAAGWAEALVLLAGAGAPSPWVEVDGDAVRVTDPAGGRATVRVGDGRVEVRVEAGEVLDETVLRSYCVGAVHMGLGWVTSESLTVTADGEVADLTVRSFGVLRAADMPEVVVEVVAGDGPPVRASDAVMVATAAAVWRAAGRPPCWPTGTLQP